MPDFKSKDSELAAYQVVAQMVLDKHIELIDYFLKGKHILDFLIVEGSKECGNNCDKKLLKEALLQELYQYLELNN